jgi:hypothetical protein
MTAAEELDVGPNVEKGDRLTVSTVAESASLLLSEMI